MRQTKVEFIANFPDRYGVSIQAILDAGVAEVVPCDCGMGGNCTGWLLQEVKNDRS